MEPKTLIYLAWEAQIALSMIGKITIIKEYLDYTDIFSKEASTKLSKRLNINGQVINLETNDSSPLPELTFYFFQSLMVACNYLSIIEALTTW